MVKEINSDGYSDPSGFVTAGDKLYFVATGPFGRELYTSDGSMNGTQIVNDFNYGSADSFYDIYHYEGRELFALDSYLLFSAQDGYFGHELYFNQIRETNIYYS